MYKNRGSAWIGFEEAKRTIDALKAEVQIAEEKLSISKRSLKFEKDKPFLRVPIKIQPSEVKPSVSSEKKDLGHFIKEKFPRKTSHYGKHVRKRERFAVPKSPDVPVDEERKTKIVSSKAASIQPADINETLVKTVIDSTFLNISSSESSDSYFNLKHKASSSEKTSSLIADTYRNTDAQLSSIIYRNEKKAVKDPSNITFTSWEKEFLRREVGFTDLETSSGQQDKSTENSLVNDIKWTPVISGTKVPNLKPKRIVHGNLKALKQIINRQKKFHEEIQAKSELDLVTNSNHKDIATSQEEPHEIKKDTEDFIHNEIDAELQFKTPPIRKKCLVTKLPYYRGFSAPDCHYTKYSRKRFKYKESIHINIESKKPAGLKRIKKTYSNQQEGASSPYKEKQLETFQNNSENHSKTKEEDEQKLSSDSNSAAQNSDTGQSSSSTRQEEVTKSNNDASFNDDKGSSGDSSPIINLNSDDEGNVMSTETKGKMEQHSKPPAVTKSVKRKAKKYPADEKMAPSPKIRHYDQQSVRNYIKKKNAERRKRHMEEYAKSLEEAQRKKENLQKLYEFHKQSILSVGKALSPSKALLKQNELRSESLKQPLLDISTASNVKNFQENGSIIYNSSGLEKLYVHPTEKVGDFTPDDSFKSLNRSKNEDSLHLGASRNIEPSSKLDRQKTISNSRFEMSVKENVQPKKKYNAKMEEDKSLTEKKEHSYHNGLPSESLYDEAKLGLKKEKKHSFHIGLPSTSLYNEAENLSSYLSTISTPSKLSQFSDVEGILPEKLKFNKTAIPTGRSKQAETLKTLAKSIGEMTEPFEHLMRTKQWLEESPPPPNLLSRIESTSATSSHQLGRSKFFKENNTDFVIDVAKSLQSAEGNSFRQQVSNVGDTNQLFKKLLGQSTNLQRKLFDSDEKVEEQNSDMHSNVEAGLIEGSLESDEETSNETASKSLEHNLIEGTLRSEDNTIINQNQADLLSSSDQNEAFLTSHSQVLPKSSLLSNNPDPFNFINTWNRKPLGIPVLSNGVLTTFKNSSSLARDTDAFKNNRFSSQRSSNDSLAVENKSFISEESFLNTAMNSSSTFIEHISDSFENSDQTEIPDNKKHSTKTSSRSTSVKSSNSSVVSESQVSAGTESKSLIEEQIETKDREENQKGKSPSESSVSEIISVIENSKNGERDTPVSSKSIKSSEFKSSYENSIADVPESSPSSSSKISTENRSIKNISPFTEERKSVTDEVKSVVDIADPLPLGSNISTSTIHESIKNASSFMEGIQDISEKLSLKDGKDNSTYHEESGLLLSKKKSEDSELMTEQSKMENISGISSSSQNSVTIDFTQPVRFTLSDGVSKSLKVHKGVPLHEEHYFHTQVVTRVASEAAAAAATSAVIAVFETQKKLLNKGRDASNRNVLMRTFNEDSSQHSRSDSIKSHKTSSDNSVFTVIESQQSTSENSVIDEVSENSSVGTAKEIKKHSKSAEKEILSEPLSESAKASTSSAVLEDLPASEKSEGLQNRNRLRKISSNLSSPSPASLSENETLSEASFIRENSAPSSSTVSETALSDDSFAQLTLDVVRKMTHEEELRASHQLALLKCQEKTLVETARAEMAWLETLKKKLREKGVNEKVSHIKRRQKDIISSLRQERAQLRCMQEAYRSICDKHHSSVADKKKLLNEPTLLQFQVPKRKDKSHSSNASSELKTRDFVRQKSDSSSTSTVVTEEELKKSIVEDVPEEMLDIAKHVASHSSQGSILEAVASEPAASSTSSYSKVHKVTPATSLPQKQGHSQSSLSLHSNNSLESGLQGLKKIEAVKRHLTKREQRILQRRKHVEKLLQWQMKLDTEEMAVRELEQKAVEFVDTSKRKTKYYISSSTSVIQDEKEKFSSSDIPEEPANPTDSMKASTSTDNVSSEKIGSDGIPESVPSDSVPEENIVTATSGDSVEEEFSKKGSNDHESSSAVSSSSVQEMSGNQSAVSSIKTAEDAAESSHIEEISINDGQSHSLKSPILKKSSSSDIYSESFESTASQKISSPINASLPLKSSTPSSGSKRERAISIKSPLAPRNIRRQDSSGSDDSYTISHSETASDQSDIDVRIHALAEELRRRKYEAEKLNRVKKGKYREHLKRTELSLQKQVEAYTQYIQQLKSDLDQIEAMSSQSQPVDISTVKPQIKWPRSDHTVDSRRIRKQAPVSSDALISEKKPLDNASSSPDSVDSSVDLSIKRGKPVIKKLLPDSKEKLKHEIGLNKDISGKPVIHENIPEKSLLPKKTPESKLSTSIEDSEQDSSVVPECHEISTEASSSKKFPGVDNQIVDKLSSEPKEESEIEEESFESTNSLLITVDSKSEKNKEFNIEADSKTAYESDSFASNSSMPKSNQDASDELNNLQSSSIPDVVPSLNENLISKSSAEETLQDSEKSPVSGQITTNDSIPSSEAEFIYESSSNASTGSVKDDLESGSFECENSDGCSSPSPRKALDKTFVFESQLKIISSPENNIPEPKNKLPYQEEEQSLSALVDKQAVNKCDNFIPDDDQKSLKEGLKSETFVINVVNYLYSLVIDDAVGSMLNLSKIYSSPTKPQSQDYKIVSDPPSLTVKKLKNKSVEKLTNELVNDHISDAISSFINIYNNYNLRNGHDLSVKSFLQSNEGYESTTSSDTSSPVDFQIQSIENCNLSKNANSVSPFQDKNDNNIFKKQSDWVEDGFVVAQWETQQFEQQLLIQQYPYYYRKIPNKPPPPYTPPAVLNINSQIMYPLPIKKEETVEEVDSVKFVTKNMGLIIDSILDTLVNGKKSGLMIIEITQSDFSSVIEQLDLRDPSQLIFLDLIFDLTKEIALDTFTETEEKPEPWLRPKRLTPKPMFPCDKNILVTSLRKKVEEALKLLPTESFAEQRRKRPTWSTMKRGRKKRDFVDTILISEIKEEEPDWVNYDQDEVTVKFQIADSIFDLLVDDTINLMNDLGIKNCKI